MTQFPGQPPYDGQPAPYGRPPQHELPPAYGQPVAYGQPQHGHYPPPGYGQAGYPPGYPPGYAPFPARKPGAPPLPAPGGLLIAAGLLGMVGAVLPWATFLGLTKNGIDGDGAITIVIAALVMGAGIWTVLRAPLGIPITALVLSALIALIAVIDISDVSSTGLSVGSGLWLTLVAGGVGLAAGIWALAARPGAKAAQSRAVR